VLAQNQVAATPAETIEQRITSLHASLKITADEDYRFGVVSMMQVIATSCDERGAKGGMAPLVRLAARRTALATGALEHLIGDLLLVTRHGVVERFE
jgi:hypothetical protein